jgi:hypothetical protein
VRRVIRSGATEFNYERNVQPQPKIGPWKGEFDRMLVENARKPKRDRLPVIRVFEELQALGYAIGRGIDARLAVKALYQAIALRRPLPRCVFHSDRGSQYASEMYRDLLAEHGFVGSMSRRGNPYDKAFRRSVASCLFLQGSLRQGLYSMSNAFQPAGCCGGRLLIAAGQARGLALSDKLALGV